MKEINHNDQPIRQIKTEQSGKAGAILHDFLNSISRGCREGDSPDSNDSPAKDYLSSEEYDNMTDEQINEYYANSYMHVDFDKHFYTQLEQILLSLKILKGYYIPLPQDESIIYVEYPPVSIEHIITGIRNTINNGYKLFKDGDNK